MLRRLIAALLLAATAAHAQTRQPWSDDMLGMSLTLPDASWQVREANQGGAARTLQFSSPQAPGLRFMIVVQPAFVAPEGLLTREAQLKAGNPNYERLAYDAGIGPSAVRVSGEPAEVLEYRRAGVSRMLGQKRGDSYVILEIGATPALWEQPANRRILESIVSSLEIKGPVRLVLPEPDLSTPAEVRSRRAKTSARPARDVEVVKHTIRAELDPKTQSIRVTDRLRVRAVRPNIRSIVLGTAVVRVDGVTEPAGVKWTTEPAGQEHFRLTIEWDRPLQAGEEQDLIVQLSSSDFVLAIDQTMVAEVGIVGQVRERSSWSSHVRWYPIDGVNDAAVDITFTVPEEYTAVTGGRFVGVESRGGKREFRYASDIRKQRLLPFGFAVARYISRAGRSSGGLPIEIYGYPGEEKLVEQRLQLAIECADLFERMMGPLPFEAVRAAHVTPVSKEMLVSLPGLLLVSDAYYNDVTGVDMSDGNPNTKGALNLIGLADELSHQWNAYAVPLPNELAEGVSTFTNGLVVEKRHGNIAYRGYIRSCIDSYLNTVVMTKDVAAADPALYASPAYRVVAFCKNAVVLDMLRSEVGDETFFAGWRRVFDTFDPSLDGFDHVRSVFSKITGTDMQWFFDQWFFQSGFPEIRTEHAVDRDTVTVTLRQTQKQPPFRVTSEVAVRGPNGEVVREKVVLSGRETQLRIKAAFPVRQVVVDPDSRLLLRRMP
jgi:hypothetical protein